MERRPNNKTKKERGTILRTDSQGNWIGRGEDTAFEILKTHLKLEPKENNSFPETGIYRQVPLLLLINSIYKINLDPIHQKGSLDIVTVLSPIKIICFRVQNGDSRKKGHKGHFGEGPKPQLDKVQLSMLRASGKIVVDLNEYECFELFKERLNLYSIADIANAMRLENIKL